MKCEKEMPECLNEGTWNTKYEICICTENYTGVRCEEETNNIMERRVAGEGKLMITFH